MPRRMPVLRQHDMLEALRDTVDDRHDLAAVRHRQRPAGAEIVLDVDHQQYVAIVDREMFGHPCASHGLRGASLDY